MPRPSFGSPRVALGAVALTLGLLAPGALHAQLSCGGPAPGDPVRLTLLSPGRQPGRIQAPADLLVAPPVVLGVFLRQTGTHMVLQVTGANRTFSLDDIAGMQVRCGGEPALGMTSGLVVGGALGGLLGGTLVACSPPQTWDAERCDIDRNPRGVLRAAALGALIGAGVGAVSSAASRGDEWVDTPLRFQAAPMDGGSWALGLRLPLR